ncbi:MAG: HEAT repeat domain-containing protein, partial [Myxococcales bacterium]|nr:HEAT repeat domain-containing protein [Myxococcales bacterium]
MSPVAQADGGVDLSIELLRESSSFRVRAQAALVLGRPPRSARAVAALERALADPHPAVRAAAASSLERLESVGSLAA